MAKAKVKVKSKGKPKGQSNGQSNRDLIGKARMRTVTHIRFKADGSPRRKGW